MAFLTPFGGAATPDETTMFWFPAVGALIGIAVGGVWWLAAKVWGANAAAAVALVTDLALTGLLHVDGLADAADGLLAPMSRDRRLRAMADPAVGAFGVAGVAGVLLLRFGALASVRPLPLAVCGLWCASRTSMVIVTEVLPYARPDGLVKEFLATGERRGSRRALLVATLVLGVVGSGVLLAFGRGLRGVVALGGELIAMGAVAALARRRIGGFTGDVLGAAGVVGETVGLLIVATR